MQSTFPANVRPATVPWYAQRWPWLLMLGPAAVVVAGAYTTWLAVRTPDAMVVDDYYKQGKAINQDLRRDRAAAALGLSLCARFDGTKLEGQLSSRGQGLTAPFRIMLAHPTQPHKDRTLLVVPDAQGHFVAALPDLERTHWQVVVEGARRDWRLAHSWDWPQRAELDIDADKPQLGSE
jgi:hypothetical protein